jgi:hypothetical protein
MENLFENELKNLSDKEMCLLKVGIRKDFKKIEIYGTLVEDYTHSRTMYDKIISKTAGVLFKEEKEDGVFPIFNKFMDDNFLMPKMINFGFIDINIKNILQYYLELEFRKRFNK